MCVCVWHICAPFFCYQLIQIFVFCIGFISVLYWFCIVFISVLYWFCIGFILVLYWFCMGFIMWLYIFLIKCTENYRPEKKLFDNSFYLYTNVHHA